MFHKTYFCVNDCLRTRHTGWAMSGELTRSDLKPYVVPSFIQKKTLNNFELILESFLIYNTTKINFRTLQNIRGHSKTSRDHLWSQMRHLRRDLSTPVASSLTTNTPQLLFYLQIRSQFNFPLVNFWITGFKTIKIENILVVLHKTMLEFILEIQESGVMPLIIDIHGHAKAEMGDTDCFFVAKIIFFGPSQQ